MKRGSKKRASHEELRDDELKETSKTVQGKSRRGRKVKIWESEQISHGCLFCDGLIAKNNVIWRSHPRQVYRNWSFLYGFSSCFFQVKVFVESTLKKGVQGLVAEFRSMKRVNDFTKMTEFVAQNAQARNRYKDVGCLDQTRVVISLGPSAYIHANYVSTPNNERRFICTQAPLPRTCAEFWYMVVQERAVAILMLCNFVEMGAKKCAEYYPQQANEIMVFDEDVTVIFKKQEPFKLPFESKVHIMMTTLEVNIRGQQPHSCIHYHWMDWPDRGVPEADLAPIFLLNKLKDSKAPIVVHCSAGIGRTGSIVLIQHAMELLNKPAPLLEISGYLEQLRMQRNNSIQTEQQYLYVHEVLLLYLKKTKYLDDALNEHLEKFARDYIKATTGF
uniref:Protein-tyrosine phosphatase n=1 Tax=Heterorhabditis bacteriophora TaxID=37862 RepID=A0A1I7XTN6_HETBA